MAPSRRVNRPARVRRVSLQQRFLRFPTDAKEFFFDLVQPSVTIREESEKHKTVLITALSAIMSLTFLLVACVSWALNIMPTTRSRFLLGAIISATSFAFARSGRMKYSLRFIVFVGYFAGIYRSIELAMSKDHVALITNHISFLFFGILSAALALPVLDILGLGVLGVAGTISMNSVLGLGIDPNTIHEIVALQVTVSVMVSTVGILYNWSFKRINSHANEFIKARDDAVEAVQVKSMFIATVSHEIRTPLHGIVGLSTMLTNSPLNDEQQDWVNNVRLCGSMLLSLSNNILELARSDVDLLQLRPVDFNLSDIVDEVMVICESSAKAAVEMLWHIDEDVPHRVLGDPVRLQQILVNLLSNATKFTERGEVVMRLSVRQPEGVEVPDTPGSEIWLEFSVKDTGCGISAYEQARLVEQEDAGNSTTTRLGLLISHRIAVLMGGNISVKSEFGKGSVFTLRLPLRLSDTMQSLPRPDSMYMSAALPYTLADKKVTVLCNDPLRASMYHRGLVQHGAICTELSGWRPQLSLGTVASTEAIVVDVEPSHAVDILDSMRRFSSLDHLAVIVLLPAVVAKNSSSEDALHTTAKIELTKLAAIVHHRPMRSNRIAHMVRAALENKAGVNRNTPLNTPVSPSRSSQFSYSSKIGPILTSIFGDPTTPEATPRSARVIGNPFHRPSPFRGDSQFHSVDSEVLYGSTGPSTAIPSAAESRRSSLRTRSSMGSLISPSTPRALPSSSNPFSSGSETTKRGKILVVEDNNVNQMISKSLIQQLGYTVNFAQDADSALIMLEYSGYDLVLTDLHMPRMDGYELSLEIRKRERAGIYHKRTPIVALTATNHGVYQRCQQAGMDAVLGKPLLSHELKDILDQFVSVSGS